MVNLLDYKVNSITFEDKVPSGTEVKLKNQFSYNVNFFDDEKRCLGMLDFRVTDEDLRPFSVRVEMQALFSYSDDDSRDDIHTQSFDQIFPFLRQIIHSTTSMSGNHGLMIPPVHIKKENIKVTDNPAANTNNNGGENSPLN